MLRLAFLILSLGISSILASGITYYTQANGNVITLSNWNTSPTGGGTSPSNFTSGDIFVINHTMTANAQWIVSGTGAKVVISSYKSFNSSGFDHDITLDIQDNGTYTHSVGTSNNLKNGTFGSNSNFTINDATGFKSDRPAATLHLTITRVVSLLPRI